MDAEGVAFCCALLLSATIVLIALWRWPSIRRPVQLRYLVPCWLLICGALFLAGIQGAGAWARQHIRSSVAEAMHQRPLVYLDGAPVQNGRAVLESVVHLHSGIGHHSYPIAPRELRVVSANTELRLTLALDSERLGEYWVYWHPFSSKVHVGRINLDDALAQP